VMPHNTIEGELFCVPANFTPVRPLSHNAYGTASCFKNTASGEDCVVQKLPIFDPAHATHILSELRLLRLLEHDNICGVNDVFPIDPDVPNCVFVVKPFFPAQLAQVIKKRPLSPDQTQYMMYQILHGLRYLHRANLLCVELKTTNVILNSECELKLCDIGFQPNRKLDDALHMEAKVNETVPSHWYSSPEILMCSPEWSGSAINIWSAGCIFAELLLQRPLFPGKNVIDNLTRITGLLGPTDQELEAAGGHTKAKTMIRMIKKGSAKHEERNLDTILHCHPGDPAADLLKKMLAFNPGDRITAEQALLHPYFADIWDEDDICDPPGPLHSSDTQVVIDMPEQMPDAIMELVNNFASETQAGREMWRMRGAGRA